MVVIDEIQKAPRLLDLVHKLIETTSLQYVITGSSGRKLRRGASNLLAGRAFVYNLFPLTHREIGDAFDLSAAFSGARFRRCSSTLLTRTGASFSERTP